MWTWSWTWTETYISGRPQGKPTWVCRIPFPSKQACTLRYELLCSSESRKSMVRRGATAVQYSGRKMWLPCRIINFSPGSITKGRPGGGATKRVRAGAAQPASPNGAPAKRRALTVASESPATLTRTALTPKKVSTFEIAGRRRLQAERGTSPSLAHSPNTCTRDACCRARERRRVERVHSLSTEPTDHTPTVIQLELHQTRIHGYQAPYRTPLSASPVATASEMAATPGPHGTLR